ncbi:MAG: HAD-IA family hydrolase, partial [Candidatus Diapherotrites archaeon]|nr:HAD-IA family hydrolase [Candidatus Diapherotrites archaeon]
GIFIWRPAVAEFIKKLRANGYKIGILSNCDAYSFPLIMSHYRLQRFVNAAAPSFKVHARKPDKKIFLTALKGLREKPESCVYIDDIQKYVQKACSLGMKAIQFKNLAQLKKELAKFGVKAK